MKTFLSLAAIGFGTLLLASPVRAQSSDATRNLAPVKALLDDLLKQANADPAEKEEKPAPAPQAQPAQISSQDISLEKLTQIQKLLNQFLKGTQAAGSEDTPDPSPSPSPAPAASAAAPAPKGQKPSLDSSTGLTTPR